MNRVIVTTAHMRSVPGLTATPGYCIAGTRAWFSRYGLDWKRFVREGLPAEAFEATGDALALRLAEHARQREADHG